MNRHAFLLAAFMAATLASTHAAEGSISGEAHIHTDASIAAGLAHSKVALPASLTGKDILLADFPTLAHTQGKAPVVVFLHGSSGINPKLGFDQWQEWLAKEGIASFIFDGMQLDNRLTYTSPVDKDIYEKIHALRASEIDIVLQALQKTTWADMERLFLAGTSEGAVAVARYDGDAFAGKLIYSWSCEDNYFVQAHQTSSKAVPVLNIISASDKYFSKANEYLGNDNATGNCQAAYGVENPNAQVLLIPGAPHTLINLPAARSATLGFIESVLDQDGKHPAINP